MPHSYTLLSKVLHAQKDTEIYQANFLNDSFRRMRPNYPEFEYLTIAGQSFFVYVCNGNYEGLIPSDEHDIVLI